MSHVPTRRLLLAAVILVLAAGCSSGGGTSAGVASLPAPTTTGTGASSSAGGTAEPSALAYSQCMREHGIADFPDPDANGDLTLEAGPGSDLDFNNPAFKAADEACKALLPEAGESPADLKAATLAYAACMREHGIADFPDPNASGGLEIQSEPGSDLDPNNPAYQKADAACRSLLPDGGEGGSTNVQNG